MFDDDQRDSIIQRGLNEALACQDMLRRSPVKPPLVARLLARLAAAVQSRSPRTRARKPQSP